MHWWAWWRPPCVLRAVIVNFRDDPTTAVKGVLWSTRGPWLVFRDCAVLKPDLPATPTDGEIVIHRERISFLQVIP